MNDAVIVDAVRTPVGRRGGLLKNHHPGDLAAMVLRAPVDRTGVDPARVDDVILGCLTPSGEQSINLARFATLDAVFPDTVPGTTVDRQCGSAQQAAHFGAQGVMAGASDAVIAAGVESMTRAPMWSNFEDRSQPYGTAFRARYSLGAGDFTDQGLSGEIVADRWEHSREELDHPALEALGKLRTVFKEDGKLTAGNSSQMSDGAAALLIMSGRRASDLGLRPRARFHTCALAGVDPVEMLSGPIPTTQKALQRSGLSIDGIGLFEVNEAFASVPLAWMKDTGADPERVSVNGGAITLGHPLGCTGERLMTTLVNEMERAGTRYGLQAMCEGGDTANATILEFCS